MTIFNEALWALAALLGLGMAAGLVLVWSKTPLRDLEGRLDEPDMKQSPAETGGTDVPAIDQAA